MKICELHIFQTSDVEKRRIYDIVNVMEALDAMSKTNKSYYKWHGLEGLPKLMDELQVTFTTTTKNRKFFFEKLHLSLRKKKSYGLSLSKGATFQTSHSQILFVKHSTDLFNQLNL